MKKPFRLFGRLIGIVKSRLGKNTITFMVFLLISTVLWGVLTLNEEDSYDFRLPVRLDHVPDTVTVVSNIPDYLNVSVRAKGSQIFKYEIGPTPELVIDFRRYSSHNGIHLGNADLKALARNALSGTSIYIVSPDSFSISYTTRPGILLPVVADCHVTAGPQSTILGRPILSFDSVRVYSTSKLPAGIQSVSTEPIRLSDVNKDLTIKAKLIAPPHSRVIPDSVLLNIKVEPLILKNRKIVIEPINVPSGVKLITFPAQVDVVYMVPMSIYSDTHPKFRVIADYNSLKADKNSRKIKIKLTNVPNTLENVYLSTDSVEYIIEK